MAGSTSDQLQEAYFTADDVAMSAVFAAAVFVGTVAIVIPVGIGFLNFGEVIIYVAAFLFGPIVGALAATGAAAADVVLGFSIFAPITLVVKGLEGLIVGYVSGESRRSKILAVALGAPVMIVGYFIAVAYFEGIPIAVATELPIDIIQAFVGLVVALPVTEALKSRLPRLVAEQRAESVEAETEIIPAFLTMGVLSVLLFWLPIVGTFVVGLIGGHKTTNVVNAVIAAILPAFIAGGAAYFVFTTYEVPIIGEMVTGFVAITAIFSAIALLVGAAVGNQISK